jgi:hypothetical protein
LGIQHRIADRRDHGRLDCSHQLLFCTAGATRRLANDKGQDRRLPDVCAWQLVHDLRRAGQVASPEHIVSFILTGFKRNPAPMTDAEKHEFTVDKIIENSVDRWLYATKPVPAQNLIAYHVNVPISGHVCAAIVTVKVGHSEDEIKKIAATVGAAR